MTRWLEDYLPGEIERFGRYEVTREEVTGFARRFDPQPFHLEDEAAAAHPLFGRIAASGWHTCAMAMAMMVAHRQARGDDAAMLAGAGIDELRWLRPVYPGDVLRTEAEVIEATPSRRHPDRGTMRSRTMLYNQADEAVLHFIATEVLRRRPG
jgi:acyl dehydratase